MWPWKSYFKYFILYSTSVLYTDVELQYPFSCITWANISILSLILCFCAKSIYILLAVRSVHDENAVHDEHAVNDEQLHAVQDVRALCSDEVYIYSSNFF